MRFRYMYMYICAYTCMRVYMCDVSLMINDKADVNQRPASDASSVRLAYSTL